MFLIKGKQEKRRLVLLPLYPSDLGRKDKVSVRKVFDRTQLRPNKMFHRLPVALAKVKSGNTFLYPSVEIAKKVYKNIINPISL